MEMEDFRHSEIGGEKEEPKKSWLIQGLGIFFVLLMAICWAAEAELTQSLQTEGSLEYYPKPLFIGYLTRSAYTIWLLPWLVWRFHGLYTDAYTEEERKLNIKKEKRMAMWSFPMMLLMFSNGYTWYLSLAHTPVSVNTVIYNCASVLVFLLSIPILNEGISVAKLLAVGCCIGGILMIFFAPTQSSGVVEVTWYGYVLLIVSVLFYALEEVLYKLLYDNVDALQSEEEKSKPQHQQQQQQKNAQQEGFSTFMVSAFFIGCCGLCNIFFMLPVLALWNYTGWEPFVWPNPAQTSLLVLNSSLDSLLFLSIFSATALLSPLIVSLGSLLVIPITIILDYFLHDYLPSPLVVGAIGLIVIGFVLVVLSGKFGNGRGGWGRGGGMRGFLFGEVYVKRKGEGVEKVGEEEDL